MLPRTLLVFAAILAALLPARADAEQPLLTMSGRGGEAWSFRRTVEAKLVRGACDDLRIRTPRGEFRTTQVGETFLATVDFVEGPNEVRAICREDDRLVAVSEPQHWTVRLADGPKAWARAVVTHAGLVLDAGRSEAAPVKPAPLTRYEWRIVGHAPITGRRVTMAAALADGDHIVTLRVTDALGRSDEAAAVISIRHGQAVNVDLSREAPPWAEDAVVYGAVPFLFGAGGLADVTRRLDAIAALGATVLWLSPITESPGDDFGYAVTDHFALRRAYGSEAELRTLVQSAHARGLRVILDFVPNHLSDQHPYYIDAARKGSPYVGFFDGSGEGGATHYFDWPHLKNLNFDSLEVQRYVIEASARWIRDFDVDGFRVDVSWGIRERAPEFWPRWREELKRIKPDLLLLAEASARDPYYGAHGFDAAYDWTEKLGEWAWQNAFDASGQTAARLKRALQHGAADSLVFRFLENNDTGRRFITRYGPGCTTVAAAMLLTLPGIPLIYAGQEIGAAFEPYGTRGSIDWARDPHGLRALYTRLIHVRAAHPALRGRQMQLVDTGPAASVVGYLRPGIDGAEGALVLLNFGEEPAAAQLADDRPGAGRYVDVLSGDVVALDAGQRTITLPAWGARVLFPDHAGQPHAHAE